MLELNFVFCVDECGGISKNNNIPWKIKEDFKYFRDVISHKFDNKPNIIICGKKTFDEMGPIKNHLTIVLTKSITKTEPEESEKISLINISSIDACVEYLKTNQSTFGKIYICGGKKVYDEFFKLSKMFPEEYQGIIYATIINKDYECDNFLDEELKNIVLQKSTEYYYKDFSKDFSKGVNFKLLLDHKMIEPNNLVEVLFLKPFNINGKY